MSSSTSLSALLHAAAFAPIEHTGWLRVTGEDRVRWLNGMVTNAVQTLAPGEGCYNFFLSAQGRIQGDCTAWMLPDAILLETAADRMPALMALLDRFIIMDDVELSVEPMGVGMAVAGPDAGSLLAGAGFDVPDVGLRMVRRADTGDILVRAASPLVPRFEVWAGSAEDLRGLSTSLRVAGALEVDAEAMDQLRLLEGTPLYGTDIREKELPQETAQERALHFSKGCYLGQEIVERIHSRGQVHRTFAGFVLTGSLPVPGTTLHTNDSPEKPVGEITSAGRIDLPGGPLVLALGYVRREALASAAGLAYDGGTAQPTALPYADALKSASE